MAGKTHHFAPIQPSGGKKKRGTCASINWPACKKCGLVLLMNQVTERARRAPCGGLEDPDG